MVFNPRVRTFIKKGRGAGDICARTTTGKENIGINFINLPFLKLTVISF